MINGKFCSRRLSLGLENTQLALEDEDLDRALIYLHHEGWNPNSTVGRASLASSVRHQHQVQRGDIRTLSRGKPRQSRFTGPVIQSDHST